MWEIWKNDHHDQADEDCDCSLNDVKPLPRSDAELVVSETVEDAGCDQVSECTGEERGRVENGHSQVELAVLVSNLCRREGSLCKRRTSFFVYHFER